MGGMPTIPGLPQVPIPVLGLAAEEAAEHVGQVTPKEIQYAESVHHGIPDVLLEATQEPFSARAVVYALLLDPREDIRDAQLHRLNTGADPRDSAETMQLAAAVHDLPDGLRLPLLDIAMPALRQMSPRQHKQFRTQVEELVAADHRLNLFEYALRCVLQRHLDAQYLPQLQRRGALPSSPQALTGPVATVLSLLAWQDAPEPAEAAAAFDAGLRSYVGGEHGRRLPPREQSSLADFDAALQALNQSAPAIKRRIVAACAACILANQHVTVREAELLRAICDTLECPMPPLFGQEADGD
jgi:hypothetical protein